MFPALLPQFAEYARPMLDYRFKTLAQARLNAQAEGCNGASYAWQSGYWAYPPQPTVIWVQPRYERYGGHHRYTPGYWHRGRYR